MKTTLFAAGLTALMSTSAMADGIGVSMALFDDNFLTVLRNGIQSTADAGGMKVQIEDAQNDVAKQLGPDQQLHRVRRVGDHRQPGRYLGHPGDVGRGRCSQACRWFM